MKTLSCKVKNSTDTVMGKITFKRHFLGKKNYIFVTDKTVSASNYAAIISSSFDNIRAHCPSYECNDLSKFSEGDVVTISKEGTISFVYEINASQNVILATEKCNHRCIMCPQPPVSKEDSRLNFNLRLISLMDKNSTEIGFSGGEPTVVGDDLFILMKAVNKQCPKSSTTLLTNGVMLANMHYATKLAMCQMYDLQVDIPLFSDIPAIHNQIVGANTFYKSVKALYNLALLGIRIGIRIVVMKQNYKRLTQFADFVYHNFPFVSQVAFMQMEFEGQAKKIFNSLWIDPFDYRNELKEAVLLLNDRGIVPRIYNSQLCILPKEIRNFAVQSISDWKDIYISECDGCDVRGKCAGFFESNKDCHSKNILRFTTK